MEKQTTMAALEKALQEGEKIVWSGKPEPFKIFDEDFKKQFLLYCAIAGGVVILLNVVYIIFAIRKPLEYNFLIPVITVALPAIYMGTTINSHRNLATKCHYLITDRRLIAYISDTMQKEIKLSDIREMNTASHGYNTSSICLGSATQLPRAKLRGCALSCLLPDVDGEKRALCVLYNLLDEDVKKVLGLIKGASKVA